MAIALANNSSVLDTAGHTETIGELTLQGGTVQTGAGQLKVAKVTSLAAALPLAATITGNLVQTSAGFQDWLVEHTPGATNDLVLAATFTTPSLATPLKLGDGTLLVTGDFQANSIFIQEGTVLFNDISSTAARLTGGTLGGTGAVGTLLSFASGGVISPGASPGTFSSSNVTWKGYPFVKRLPAGRRWLVSHRALPRFRWTMSWIWPPFRR